MKNKSIAILGGGGFIGTSLIDRLDACGYNLILINRKESKRKCNKKHMQVCYSEVGEDIFSDRNITCSTFINLAWKGVSGSNRNDKSQITYNIPLTTWSVELANKLNCEHWIGFGSQAEYGNANVKLTEDTPCNPSTLYGFAKVSSSYASLGLCKSYNIKGTWVRLFDPYGPGDADYWFIPFLINSFLKNKQPSITKCEQRWDYLYIDDAIDAIVALINNKPEGIFNLGSGSSVCLKKIVEYIKAATKSSVDPLYGGSEYRNDQVMHLESSIEKISKYTGWSPKTSIYDGIDKTIEAFVQSK